MTDMTPVPTEALERLRESLKNGPWAWSCGQSHPVPSPTLRYIENVLACLPEPPPEWSDEVVEAFHRAVTVPYTRNDREHLDALHAAGLDITLRETP